MNEITTVAGRKVKILPVARVLTARIRLGLLKEYESRGEVMTIPTYFVKTVAGDTQEFPHDEKTILEAPQEDRDKWAAFFNAQIRFEAEASAKAAEFLLTRGIVIDDSEMESALKSQTEYNIDIPTDPIKRKLHYIETEILTTTLDIINATQAIILLSMSGVEEETLRAVEESFRRALESAGRPRFTATEDGQGKLVQPA
jgi:hypothetical protein